MLDWTKANGWYWFCDLRLEDGSICHASEFKLTTKTSAMKHYTDHITKVAHKS